MNRTATIIIICMGICMANIFAGIEQPHRGSTKAKVITVIEYVCDDSDTRELPGYNGAGNQYVKDLNDLYDFYYADYQKGKHTPLSGTMDYNKKSEYERIIKEFRYDEIAATGHTPNIA